MGSERTATSSSDALPQIPHDARRDEVPLRDLRGIERTGEMDCHLVVGLVHRRRVAGRRPDDLRSVDEPLRPEEADRELVLVTRRPHRDRDRNGVLARTGRPDLQRLLADHRSPRNSREAPRTATTRVVVTWRVGGATGSMLT
jgi:hypothetical protein